MTGDEFIEVKEELSRLEKEGKYTEIIIPGFELSEREEELDLLDRKCNAWVKGKLEEKKQ